MTCTCITCISGDGPHKPLAFDQILVHLFLLFVFSLINKILFKPSEEKRLGLGQGRVGMVSGHQGFGI